MKPKSFDASINLSTATANTDVATARNNERLDCYATSCTTASDENTLEPNLTAA